MRTRAILISLALTLAASGAAGGCQVIAGLTVLQVTGGAGGSGGQGGSCVPCANGQPCVDKSDCESGFCSTSVDDEAPGICKATKSPGVECSVDDECGTGHCTDGVCCQIADCGGECLSCAASKDGTCAANQGATCGVTCDDDKVLGGACDAAGQCANVALKEACTPRYACDPVTKTCNTSCTTFDDCSSTGLCIMPTNTCVICGTIPPNSTCAAGVGSCETCDANADNTCVKTCDAAGECDADRTLAADKGPTRLVCNDQCNGITVSCLGPFPCEVVCDSGGCTGLKLVCGSGSPCKLTCNGTGCAGVKMECGESSCDADCTAAPAATVEQTCNGSCGCAKQACQ